MRINEHLLLSVVARVKCAQGKIHPSLSYSRTALIDRPALSIPFYRGSRITEEQIIRVPVSLGKS